MQLETNPEEYIFKEGDYRVNIRIYECSDLIPKSDSGYINPFVIIKVGGLAKKTKYQKKILNPLFDKIYNFEF
jgi:Ca2+-dependent lipid-binding protein